MLRGNHQTWPASFALLVGGTSAILTNLMVPSRVMMPWPVLPLFRSVMPLSDSSLFALAVESYGWGSLLRIQHRPLEVSAGQKACLTCFLFVKNTSLSTTLHKANLYLSDETKNRDRKNPPPPRGRWGTKNHRSLSVGVAIAFTMPSSRHALVPLRIASKTV